MNCLFCKIAASEIPSHKVYEDDRTFAFLDINPRSPGHTMVISKHHAPTIIELPEKEVEPLFLTVQKVAAMVKKALEPDGFTMGINHGSVSGQTVDHLHVHIIPRWHTDNGHSIHSVVNNPPDEDLASIAKKIQNAA